ncbi:WD40 repeat-like protein [Hymenopellis radicata]|nr:WD40 repeat-like protein [Hymenopellis radicata]
MAEASIAYISAATNRFTQAAAVSPSGSLIAFGSSNLVALWNLETSPNPGVYKTLSGHEATVTCLDFLDDESLISGDEKGAVLHWVLQGDKWTYTRVQAHTKGISALCVHSDAHILATGSSDALTKVWDLNSHAELQSLSLGGRYPLSMKTSFLPGSKNLILAIATTDRSIQIWTKAEGATSPFIKSASLSGHDDWVRCLAFRGPLEETDVLVLASGSHDSTIRLWKIEPFKQTESGGSTDALLDAFEASLGEVTDEGGGGRQVSLKDTSSQQYSMTFDALLIGHEAGVTSLTWRPTSPSAVPTLLSTSTDSSAILWSPSTIISNDQDEQSAIWINIQRFGDIGGQRLGGFIGGLWGRKGGDALAWGWSGGWRRWKCSDGGKSEKWTETHAISGHSGPVKGLAWSPNGRFLASTGLDQTTRLHAPLTDTVTTWHELARPQVHGFDLLSVCFLDNLKFVSIGDEKVARVFEAPKSFVDVVTTLNVASFDEDEIQDRPMRASVPPLGLSNKATSEGPQEISEMLSTTRPLEGELAASTLWPEVEKVFGHGYESITLATSHAHDIVASACKSTSAEHAVPLAGHALTVTRIAFSPDDKLVLSVSRDRTWRLFEREVDTKQYKPIGADKSHARIIWDCAWSHEGDIFATASRDKTVKIWKASDEDNKWSATTLKLSEAATAVDFAPCDGNKRRYLAIGLETGEILIYSSDLAEPTVWSQDMSIPRGTAHLAPGCSELASCSEDGSLRILRIR